MTVSDTTGTTLIRCALDAADSQGWDCIEVKAVLDVGEGRVPYTIVLMVRDRYLAGRNAFREYRVAEHRPGLGNEFGSAACYTESLEKATIVFAEEAGA
jgi:hypothetical protein